MRYSAAIEPDAQLAALLSAAQTEPVFIERERRDVAVLVSVEEYERLRGTIIEQFNVFCDGVSERAAATGLTEAKLNELLNDA